MKKELRLCTVFNPVDCVHSSWARSCNLKSQVSKFVKAECEYLVVRHNEVSEETSEGSEDK